MPSMTSRRVVGANATDVNIFAPQLHYRLRVPSRIRVYATASAVGLNATVQIGDEVFLNDQEVSNQNRMPLVPDDFVVEAAGVAGDEIVFTWRNTTASAITGFARVDISPL